MATSRLCSIPVCGKQVDRRGLCGSHYWRLKKYGDPLAGATPKGAVHEWVSAHLSYSGEDCLIWPFARNVAGYGNIKVGEIHLNAHRYICLLVHGEPPTPEHEAAHSCGNGEQGCVHPSHLSWKTPVENAADKMSHGKMSKLTEDDVRTIRSLRGKLTQTELAERFGIGRGAINHIQNGHSWTRVA